MPSYVSVRRVAAERGKFAHLFTTCKGCLGDLLDVHGTGLHPTDYCERRAAATTRRAASAA